MFLSPLLLGVLWFGNHFWQQQDPPRPRVTQSELVGIYTSCEELLTAVRNSVLVNVNNVSRSTDVGLDDVTAAVVDFVPQQVGIDVSVHVSGSAAPVVGESDVDVRSSTLVRLENARLDVQTC